MFLMLFDPDNFPVRKILTVLAVLWGLTGAVLNFIWVSNCFDERRKSGYKWPDWEMEGEGGN